ncbi:MAG: hypothetical protein J5807_03185 [Kiritimatiellae bacterium]|jgi:hypothetical protein|nr:hypothetical protein [Kiritimatiellia bacterium]
MADGAYERRGPREAELARLEKMIASVRKAAMDGNGGSAGQAAKTGQK